MRSGSSGYPHSTMSGPRTRAMRDIERSRTVPFSRCLLSDRRRTPEARVAMRRAQRGVSRALEIGHDEAVPHGRRPCSRAHRGPRRRGRRRETRRRPCLTDARSRRVPSCFLRAAREMGTVLLNCSVRIGLEATAIARPGSSGYPQSTRSGPRTPAMRDIELSRTVPFSCAAPEDRPLFLRRAQRDEAVPHGRSLAARTSRSASERRQKADATTPCLADARSRPVPLRSDRRAHCEST